MSMPVEQQPSSVTVTQESYTTHSGHGSIGPVVAVLAVIVILGVLAGLMGRLCFGKRIMGHVHYDIEGWMERKCSSYIDGRINTTPHPSTNESVGSSISDVPMQTAQETKKVDQSPAQNPPASF